MHLLVMVAVLMMTVPIPGTGAWFWREQNGPYFQGIVFVCYDLSWRLPEVLMQKACICFTKLGNFSEWKVDYTEDIPQKCWMANEQTTTLWMEQKIISVSNNRRTERMGGKAKEWDYLGKENLKKTTYIRQIPESETHAQNRMHAQKRPEKTLNFHLWLIISLTKNRKWRLRQCCKWSD